MELEELHVLVNGIDLRLHSSAQIPLCGLLVRTLGRLIRELGAADAPGIAPRFFALASYGASFEAWLGEFRNLVTSCLTIGHHRVPDNRVARRVLDLIDREHANETFSLQEAANQLRLSLSHTSRLVKEETGDTFTVHLRRRRVRAAQGFLQNTPLTMKEIAIAAGFGDASTFSRQFRQAVGITPSAYRNGSAARH
jgi:AraC-like DNA-binding protein